MVPSHWRAQLISWASSKPDIRELWLFGSRARGNNRDDSDIDLAVILNGEQSARLATWISQAGIWKEELQQVLPVPVDLDLGDADLSEKIVAPAIEREGYRIYPVVQGN